MKKSNLNSVGKSEIRKDAFSKVTGQSLFINDVKFPCMLYAATVRAPKPHIRILSIDDSAAKKLPGVKGIYYAKDVPGDNRVPLVFQDYPFLAGNIAKFQGQAVALVAAEDPATARRAASMVKIKYKELPAVFDALEAMKKKSPKIYGKDNIFKKFTVKKGDIKKARAEIEVEDTFTVNYQVHAYLETQGAIAVPRDDGGMVVYGSMQCPFYVQDAVAKVLGQPYNKVTIIQQTTGGAFGGKEDVPSIVCGHAAMLARLTGRPVKLIYSREEDFQSMSKRHPGWAWIKYGATKKGRIVSCKVMYVLDGGAFATLSPIVLWRGTVHASGPYEIDNVLIETYAAATNKVPCGAYRGFGQPQISFANESLIDMLAGKLNMDPSRLREINAIKKGGTTATNQKITESIGLLKTMTLAKKSVGWSKKWKKPSLKKGVKKYGIGMASSIYGVGLGAGGQHLAKSGSFVQIEPDGSALIAVGNTEMGQGARTVLSQIAAETLGAPYELVDMMPTDTSRVPDSGPTVASRTTVMSGTSVMNACKVIRARIDEIVRKELKVKGKVSSENGFYKIGNKKAPYAEIIARCWAERVHLSHAGWFRVEGTTFGEKDGQGDPYFVYTWSTMIAEVEVDTETGLVEVLNFVSAHDIGKAVNPREAEGQIQGGSLQGIGYALSENLVIDKGRMLNPNFTGYIIPTIEDSPDIKPIIVEERYPKGPYGAKGLGEPPLICAAPAIANAVYNATGKRIKDLPLIPERVKCA
ncbi:MAG: xanthine dehydrogenase family protein molybdopterin-binding subunit [Elusimicrobiota bacterium]|nr:xanthine dehydrogenase family protein molybdopterin-binding subunit [Elusimicrobiota bacterium]